MNAPASTTCGGSGAAFWAGLLAALLGAAELSPEEPADPDPDPDWPQPKRPTRTATMRNCASVLFCMFFLLYYRSVGGDDSRFAVYPACEFLRYALNGEAGAMGGARPRSIRCSETDFSLCSAR